MINLDRKENVGTLGAYIRVSGGLVLLALATFGRFGRLASWTLFTLGASSVASGIARYCPVTELITGPSVEEEGDEENEAPLPRDLPWEDEAGGSGGRQGEPARTSPSQVREATYENDEWRPDGERDFGRAGGPAGPPNDRSSERQPVEQGSAGWNRSFGGRERQEPQGPGPRQPLTRRL